MSSTIFRLLATSFSCTLLSGSLALVHHGTGSYKLNMHPVSYENHVTAVALFTGHGT